MPSTCQRGPQQYPHRDVKSRVILKRFHPIILSHVYPRAVYGDGNCLYRAVFLAVYGNQSHHLHLRLLTAMEILQFPHLYDVQSPSYKDVINDNRVVVSSYQELLDSVLIVGKYAELMHMYALSSVPN